jgi:hypothetical protein
MLAIGGPPGGARTTFCISSYGWSNGWFATTTPGTAPGNANINLLGDSAQFLSYTQGGVAFPSWLTPTLSIGGVPSDFSVATPVAKLGNDEAQSVITDGRVSISIDSTVVQDNIRMTFSIENVSSAPIASLEFVQYLNFFPYGSTHPTLGTMNYQPVPTLENTFVEGLWGGTSPSSFVLIRQGGTCGGPGTAGCSTPTAHDIGAPPAVIADIQAGTFNGVFSANNNAAGALSWTIPNLNLLPGQTTQFTVELVSEPGTLGLILLGAFCLLVLRRGVRTLIYT